jgi:hypothetical protein
MASKRGRYNARGTQAIPSPTDAFKGSRARAQQVPHVQPPRARKGGGVDGFKTLKRACPPEYQRAQGAFKDSMIH